MARYKVLLIRKGIKIGQVVPYGATKEITVIGVSNKTEAKKKAKKRIGKNWAILSVNLTGIPDPDARR